MAKVVTDEELENRKALGIRIRDLRECAALSGDKFAYKVWVASYGDFGKRKPDRKAVHKWEQGRTDLSSDQIGWIAEALEVSPGVLNGDIPQAPFVAARFLNAQCDRRISPDIEHKVQNEIRGQLKRWWASGVKPRWQKFISPCSRLIRRRDIQWIEKVADGIRAEWGLGSYAPIMDLSWSLFENAVLVTHVTAKGRLPEKPVVYCAWLAGSPLIAWVGAVPAIESELVEYRFRIFMAMIRLLLNKAGASPADISKFSPRIARAVFMPRSSLACSSRNQVTPEFVGKIAGLYGLPTEHVVKRMAELDLLTADQTTNLLRQSKGIPPRFYREVSPLAGSWLGQ